MFRNRQAVTITKNWTHLMEDAPSCWMHDTHHPYPLLCKQGTVKGRHWKITGKQHSSFYSHTWKHNEM